MEGQVPSSPGLWHGTLCEQQVLPWGWLGGVRGRGQERCPRVPGARCPAALASATADPSLAGPDTGTGQAGRRGSRQMCSQLGCIKSVKAEDKGNYGK